MEIRPMSATDIKPRTRPGDLILGAARMRNEATASDGTAPSLMTSGTPMPSKPEHGNRCPNGSP